MCFAAFYMNVSRILSDYIIYMTIGDKGAWGWGKWIEIVGVYY